jgi:hypothetical protein
MFRHFLFSITNALIAAIAAGAQASSPLDVVYPLDISPPTPPSTEVPSPAFENLPTGLPLSRTDFLEQIRFRLVAGMLGEVNPIEILPESPELSEVDPIEILPEPPPIDVDPFEIFPEPPSTPPSAGVPSYGLENLPTRLPPSQMEVDPNEILPKPSQPSLGPAASLGFENAPLDQPAADTAIGTNECDITFEMPFEILRSVVFYLLTEDASECSTAVREIRSLGKTFGEDARRQLARGAFLNDPDHELARNLVKRYVDNCSFGLDGPAIGNLITSDSKHKILESVGVIKTPSSSCMGTIVDGHVLTARHCFIVSDQEDRHRVIVPESGVTFTTLDGSKFDLKRLAGLEPDLLESERDKDWILLGLDSHTAFEMKSGIPLKPNLATRWRPLVLLSISPYKLALQGSQTISPDILTIDISPLCSVLARDRDYIFHSCQTLRGMSGSPLLTVDGGQIAIVGIHTGEANKLRSACGEKLSPRYINYGVVPELKEALRASEGE